MKGHAVVKILTVLWIAVLLGACTAPAPQTSSPSPVMTEAPGQTLTPSPAPTSTETPAVPTQEPVIPTETVTPEAFSAWLAYVGTDGNIWLWGGVPAEQKQITADAAGFGSGSATTPVVIYSRPKWSSDGRLLVFERQEGRPVDSGYTFQNSLWIYDQSTGAVRLALQDQATLGYDWMPGKHVIAYSEDIDPNYFSMSGPDSAYAMGIRLFDVDNADVMDFVQPERGFHLAAPEWSPDGRFLSFREVYGMEGAGMFAYYDLAAQQYIAWDEAIGGYAWSSDGETIFFDTLTYTAQGDEAIYTRPRTGGESTLFSPQPDNGYTYFPAVSEDGRMVAYLADRDGLDGSTSNLIVVDMTSGERRELGNFDSVASLGWSAGWPHIVLTRNAAENSEIVLVSPFDGAVTVVARGSQPDWNPAVKLQ